jgi:transcription antitermination factor NusA-like protein
MGAGMPMMDPAGVGQKRGREDAVYNQQSKVLAAGGVMMRLLMVNNEAGTIIGTGGANIREIRDNSGCHVNVGEALPGQNERVVSLTGTTEQVQVALRMSVDKLEEASQTPAGEKRVSKVLIPNEQIGSVIGKGGQRAREIREQSGAFMNISAANEIHAFSPERIVTVTGEPQQCVAALVRITDQLADHPLEDRPYRGNYDLHSAQVAQPARPPAAAVKGGGPECTAQFLVLNEHAGHLIGKGGSVINELRNQSGCKIDMSRGEPGMTERPMTLSGSIQQCQLAQHLISCKLATVLMQLQQFEERDKGGGHVGYAPM